MIVLAFMTVASQAQVEGYWKGQLNFGIQKLAMAFDIKTGEKGYSSTLDVPAQGAYDVPVEETSFQDGRLTMTMTALDATYSGVLKDTVIQGEFKQHGMSFPLELTKAVKQGPASRLSPQDPQPQYGYRV